MILLIDGLGYLYCIAFTHGLPLVARGESDTVPERADQVAVSQVRLCNSLVFTACVVLKSLVSLIGHLVACNPRCACTPRVNNRHERARVAICLIVAEMICT